MPKTTNDPPDPLPSEADLCDRYIAAHQTTVYANGGFWRNPWPDRPWVPVSDAHIAAEVLQALQVHQGDGLPPTRHRLRSVLELLRLKLDTLAPGAFDNSDDYIPFPEARWHMDTGEFHPYSPDDYVATTLPYAYDNQAACPHWEGFLQSTLPAAADFLQEFAGYCLTPYTHFELSLWVCGAPSSGKSTLIHGLQTLLGPFAGPLALDDLARRQLHPHTFARKRLLIADEVPAQGDRLPALTPLIDGTPFHLRRPHGRALPVQSQAKLLLSFNGLPSPDGRHASLYRRAALLLLPPRPPGRDDVQLKQRLSQEGPGLYMWAKRGLNRLWARGHFQPPATMLAAAQQLRLAATSPKNFIAERCRRDPHARTQSSLLSYAYRTWCEAQGLSPVSDRRLATQWRDLGFEYHRLEGRSWWFGVQLIHTDPAVPAYLNPAAPSALPPAAPALSDHAGPDT